MSYFLFGFLDFDEVKQMPDARTRVRTLAEQSAAIAGICAKVVDPAEQSLLSEMRGPYSPECSLPFLLTETPDDDTSEGLLSPLPGGIRDSVPRVVAVAEWIFAIFAAKEGVSGVRVWFSDGLDVDFERHSAHPDELARVYERRLTEEKDIPPMLFSVHPK